MHLILFAIALFGLPAGSTVSVDGTRFEPIAQWQNPGVASPFRPLGIWVRIPFDPALNERSWYVVASDDVGRATLWAVPYGTGAYAREDFGMRVPFDERSVARIPPTVRVPNLAPGVPLYLQLSLDGESRVEPIVRLVDDAQLASEDAAVAKIASIAILFIGVFLSLGAAALFVFYFIREITYVAFAAWSVANAALAAVYLHPIAWQWLWPSAAIPAPPALPIALVFLGAFLLCFARLFLASATLVPRIDATVTWTAVALLVIGASCAIYAPSMHLGPFIGRDLLIASTLTFNVLILGLAIAAWRAGSVAARFFVGANLVVAFSSTIAGISNLYRYASGPQHADFAALMVGLSLQGWLFFGALAYRLREAFGAYMDEQQQRLIAQAESLAQARALVEERQISTTDQLTGIANRRAFDEALVREWDRCARAGAPLSLLMLDIDFFKRFNDTYGHVGGDRTLRAVAEAIGGVTMRPGDRACRYGGEEFAVILPETNEAGASALAADICEAVRALRIAHEASAKGTVSVSIGVATVFPVPGAAPHIVELADEALYRAKENGRDRFVTAGYGGPSHTPVQVTR